VTKLLNLGDVALDELLQSSTSGETGLSRPATFLLRDKFTHDGWRALVSQYPHVAVNLWSSADWVGRARRPRALDSRRTVDAIASAVIRAPQLLVRNPATWSRLVRLVPHRAVELRRALMRAAQSLLPVAQPFGRAETLRVDLPGEAVLLPFVLASAFTARSSLESLGADGIRESLRESVGIITRERARSYGAISASARAALQLIAIMESGDIRDEDIQIIVGSYQPANAVWLLAAFAAVVRLLAIAETETTRALVGRLLEMSRDDYDAREELDDTLWLWREASKAPITTAGLADRWLAGVA